MADGVEIIPVREIHQFNEGALFDYLTENVDGFSGPLQISQFQGGQSNPTFLLKTPEREYVMRKKPPGNLLPSAHAVEKFDPDGIYNAIVIGSIKSFPP